ncbi:hypothetical protein DITRI_Ditri17bG0062600 [Diplodiscus trichospermus]
MSYDHQIPPTRFKVSELMIGDSRTWNEDIIRDLFSTKDADLISSIPLNRKPVKGKLIWADSEISTFSVKSTYFLARKSKGKSHFEVSQRKAAWGLICHPLETINHVFFHCKLSKETWSIVWTEALQEEPMTTPVVSWNPPLSGTWNVNIDASFSKRNRAATLRTIVRDSHRAVHVCEVKAVSQVETPFQAKLLAILFGTELACRLSFSNLVVESDLILAVSEISKNDNTFCWWGGIVKNIYDMANVFDSISFSFVKREANVFAHNLSKSSFAFGGEQKERTMNLDQEPAKITSANPSHL